MINFTIIYANDYYVFNFYYVDAYAFLIFVLINLIFLTLVLSIPNFKKKYSILRIWDTIY
jgi:hypothetical protein